MTQFDNPFLPFNPFTIGLDATFEQLERISSNSKSNNYPPYNIVDNGNDSFTIELACAGFGKSELEVALHNGVLTVTSCVSTVQKQDLRTFVHRGISKRHFTKEFKLADDVNIQSVGMSDGMLNINLLKVIPEDKKRKVLNID